MTTQGAREKGKNMGEEEGTEQTPSSAPRDGRSVTRPPPQEPTLGFPAPSLTLAAAPTSPVAGTPANGSSSTSSSARDPAVDRLTPRIKGYKVTGQLGQGGMGVVWSAVQLGTRRTVALKLLGANMFASPRARRRFEREVELAARLNHPHVARVYDSGLDSGVYYYAMELVHGQPLDKYVKDRKLPRPIRQHPSSRR